MAQNLNDILDIFKCCILTWRILITMVPALILAGAIAAFMPAHKILRYLGHGARWYVSYPVAALSGVVLSLCSCNIVPLFVSIYRRGAGIGPASTFLYSGPAINVLSMVFTFQVIGPKIGIWRALGIPAIAILTGLVMAALWGRHEAKRAEEAARESQAASGVGDIRYAELLLVGLLGLIIVGSLPAKTVLQEWLRAGMMGVVAVFVLLVARAGMTREDVGAWAKETWGLTKSILPILVPAILVIAVIAKYTPLLVVDRLVGDRNPLSIVNAAVFGALMYFPILTEVAFTKAFMKTGMDPGPALALLMTGAGLSLPGMVLVWRATGGWRLISYVVTVTGLAIAFSYAFKLWIGPYICPCMK